MLGKTLWNDESPERERQMVDKLQSDGVWKEMEEDFKAKQLVINFIGLFCLFTFPLASLIYCI
jgi:cytokinesis protein